MQCIRICIPSFNKLLEIYRLVFHWAIWYSLWYTTFFQGWEFNLSGFFIILVNIKCLSSTKALFLSHQVFIFNESCWAHEIVKKLLSFLFASIESILRLYIISAAFNRRSMKRLVRWINRSDHSSIRIKVAVLTASSLLYLLVNLP